MTYIKSPFLHSFEFVKKCLIFIVVTTLTISANYFIGTFFFEKNAHALNWCWPVLLILASLFSYKFLSPTRFKKTTLSNKLICLLLIVCYWIINKGFPHTFPITAFIIYQGIVSFVEELFFRGIVFNALWHVEEKSYQSAFLKIVCPLSFVIVNVIFALLHGLNPILNQSGSFDWEWFSLALFYSIQFTLLYILSRSVLLPSAHHFISNIQDSLW